MNPTTTSPQFDPRPGDTQTWAGAPLPYYVRQHTVVSRDGDKVTIRSVHFDGTSKDGDMPLDAWSDDGGGRWVFDRPTPKTGPQYDPQPGDVMTYHPRGSANYNTRTVTKVEEDGTVFYDLCWVRGGTTNTEDGDSMARELWAEDFDGAYTYTRPAAPAPTTGPQFDPQPGDVLRRTASTCTVTRVEDGTVYYRCRFNDDAFGGSMSLDLWSDDFGGRHTYARPTPKARTAEDAYNDPQVGDTKTALHSGVVYTVTRRDGDYLDTDWVERSGKTGCFTRMGLGFWGTDFPDRWVYAPAGAAPAAPKVRTSEDARTNPRPGDTMKYAHDDDVYTVTAVDDDTVTCTVNLSRKHWSDSWGGTYTPGAAPAPTPESADDTLDRLARALADADTARKDAQDALAAAEKAVDLAARATAGWAVDRATLETATLYLTACRAVMSPAQCSAVEVLVALAVRA